MTSDWRRGQSDANYKKNIYRTYPFSQENVNILGKTRSSHVKQAEKHQQWYMPAATYSSMNSRNQEKGRCNASCGCWEHSEANSEGG